MSFLRAKSLYQKYILSKNDDIIYNIFKIFEEISNKEKKNYNLIIRKDDSIPYMDECRYFVGGNYDFRNDVINLNYNYFQYIKNNYTNSYFETIKHLIYHEMFHAENARNFEQYNVFPNTLKIHHLLPFKYARGNSIIRRWWLDWGL